MGVSATQIALSQALNESPSDNSLSLPAGSQRSAASSFSTSSLFPNEAGFPALRASNLIFQNETCILFIGFHSFMDPGILIARSPVTKVHSR